VNIFKKVLGAIFRYVVYILNDGTPGNNTATRGYVPGEEHDGAHGFHRSDVDNLKRSYVQSPKEGIDGEEDF